MTVEERLNTAIRQWLKAAVTPALTDRQVVVSDEGAVRAPLPHLRLDWSQLAEQRGEDERHVVVSDEGTPAERVELVMRGARRAVLEVQAFGAGALDWLLEAALALADPSVTRVLAEAGVCVRASGPVIDVGALLDTAREDRWAQEFEVTYRIERARDVLPVATAEVVADLYTSTPDDDDALALNLTLETP